MDLLLIRHGRVEAAQHGRFYGGVEVELSPEGRTEAEAAGRALASHAIDRIWSSPLARARFGADQVARFGSGRPRVEVDPKLREIDRGRWVGLSKSELLGGYPGDWAAHQADLENWRGHGGESMGDLARRVSVVWERLNACSGRQVVVSHLFPTRCLIGLALGEPLEAWVDREIPTASISLLRQAEGRWELLVAGWKPSFVPGLSAGSPQDFPQF